MMKGPPWAFFAFAATIPLANWMIGNVGTCTGQICTIPVGFGLVAPSGVLAVGAALVLRDIVHEVHGAWGAAFAVVVGAFLSGLFAPAPLAFASFAAFLLAELADLGVYAPLRERRLWLAVLASGIAGAVIDSAVFLWLAFGSLDFLAGQVVGKTWMSLLAVSVLLAVRSNRIRKTAPSRNQTRKEGQ